MRVKLTLLLVMVAAALVAATHASPSALAAEAPCGWTAPTEPFGSRQPNTSPVDMVDLGGGSVLTLFTDGRRFDAYNGAVLDASVTRSNDVRTQPTPTVLTAAAPKGIAGTAVAKTSSAVVVASVLRPARDGDTPVLQIDRSTDAGRSWSSQQLPAPPTSDRIRLSADGSTFVAAVGSYSSQPRVVRSTDDGVTWAWGGEIPYQGDSGFRADANYGFDLAVTGTQVTVVGSGSQVWRTVSSDSGAHFPAPARLTADSRNEQRPEVEAHGRDVVIAWAVQTGQYRWEQFIAHSQDGGQTFAGARSVIVTQAADSSTGPFAVTGLRSIDTGFELYGSSGRTDIATSADGEAWQASGSVDSLPSGFFDPYSSLVILPVRFPDGSYLRVAAARRRDTGSDAPPYTVVSVQQPDTTAPETPSPLTFGSAAARSITWAQPANGDTARSVLVRKDGTLAPISITDGTVLRDTMAPPSVALRFDDQSAPTGSAFSYAAFAVDGCGNVSPPATATQTWHGVPSVTISPSVVRFGQAAYVTITGTPGAAVDLYSRKYRQNSFTKIRDGLILDDSGQTTVTTKPDVNLRFMAKDLASTTGSSIAGTAGLMTVQKQVSLSISRVGVNRYMFRGTINPMHPGATVGLFRNGALVKSGIPVSGSRIYSFTSTLPAGTYSFQTRSGSTGYNAASESALKSVRIY